MVCFGMWHLEKVHKHRIKARSNTDTANTDTLLLHTASAMAWVRRSKKKHGLPICSAQSYQICTCPIQTNTKQTASTMKKKQLIQMEQVGTTAVIFKFHLSEKSTVLAPATPRKNGVWLQNCVQQKMDHAAPVQSTPTVDSNTASGKAIRTRITIAELLNPMD